MPTTRLSTLFDRFLNKSCTVAEKQELAELILDKENAASINDMLEQAWQTTTGEEDISEGKVEELFNSILATEKQVIPLKKRKMKRMNWSRWAVAASVILVLGVGSYFTFFNKKIKQSEIVKTEATKDVKAPEINRAMITLADGRTVYLDSAANGELVQQGNIKLIKLDNGQIAYQTASGEIINELKYNTLNNPRGSKVIDMTLADGSRVWLNAGSSITFPVAFIGNERKVTVTGEAYFEVAHNSTMPFKVSKGEMEVTVLGTHFNVNAYDDEADIKITLLEGSVKVNNTTIKPGQQAQVRADIKVIGNVNLEEVMAWKNGNFKFSRTDLKIIMREIGRWYDVEIVYEGNIPVQLYNVGVPRTANVLDVLKGLEYTGAHFSVEGKKIIVRP